ncbi:MAG: hypothetical protein ABXS91_03885 [Sulfurimonas sp.]
MITVDEFLEACQKSFDAIDKDFGRDAETEARCWYSEELAQDKELMKYTVEKLALLSD